MLKEEVVSNAINAALEKGGDFAEIFAEDKLTGSIRMVGGKIEDCLTGRDYGVGIRIIKDMRSIYAYTNDSTEENLVKLAKVAASSLDGGTERELSFIA